MLANAASFVLIQDFRFNVCLEIFWIRNTGLTLPIEPGYVDRKSKFRKLINNSYREFSVHSRYTPQVSLPAPVWVNILNQHKNPQLYRRPPVSA